MTQSLQIANIDRVLENIDLDFEEFVCKELGLHINDKIPVANAGSGGGSTEVTGVCNFYLRGHCWKGSACQYRHLTQQEYAAERQQKLQQSRMLDRAVVCKHWLRGLCKKGEQCEFLHEYNMKKMPECWFYTKNGECSNGDECIYQHIDPESRVRECAWYARGFCKHGPKCRNKHVRRAICKYYLFGFCPKGPDCQNSHPSFELPIANDVQTDTQASSQDGTPKAASMAVNYDQVPNTGYRPLQEVTCFKCGELGHYANRCPNGRTGPIIPMIRRIHDKKD
ncbi:Cleavage and polyadenylation specificity factor subunit 4 [Spiromyces aspiralis]|uniref:Cleavage and polyadenylation specificity factor subunit 4 n=1 Tax=Spiromyces aspiralis TaxID=68401 RepID=A0ACC1HI12_9FUNG|nr:Cleavage and polyadenylation specificity factor subunit 4 [Spiromyces aspiralis]